MRVSRFRVRDGKGSESCDVMLSLLSCVHRHPQLSSHIWRLLLHFTALLVFKMEADIRLIEKLLVIHCHTTRNGRLYACQCLVLTQLLPVHGIYLLVLSLT